MFWPAVIIVAREILIQIEDVILFHPWLCHRQFFSCGARTGNYSLCGVQFGLQRRNSSVGFQLDSSATIYQRLILVHGSSKMPKVPNFRYSWPPGAIYFAAGEDV